MRYTFARLDSNMDPWDDDELWDTGVPYTHDDDVDEVYPGDSFDDVDEY